MMSKHKILRMLTVGSIIFLLSIAANSQNTFALVSQNNLAWSWGIGTNISAVATGDVVVAGQQAVISGGWFNDGTRFNAFVSVQNGATLVPSSALTWYWTGDTQVSSLAVGDVNGDGHKEVVAGGAFFDNVRWNAFVAVLNGSTLNPLYLLSWYWTNNTQVSSVAVSDVNNDAKLEILVGGSFFDNLRWNAFLATLNGSTMVPLSALTWYWTSNTFVSSLSAADVNSDGLNETVAVGSFFDNTRWNAWVGVLNGNTLAPLNVLTWYWTGDTQVLSVALGDVNADGKIEIVSAGEFYDNTRLNAFVCVQNGTTLVPVSAQMWYWTSNTYINSVSVGNYTGGANLDIITAGVFNDGARNNGHVENWNGPNLAFVSSVTWFTTSDTSANSVAIGNFGSGNRIVSGGSYWDLTKSTAQLLVWG